MKQERAQCTEKKPYKYSGPYFHLCPPFDRHDTTGLMHGDIELAALVLGAGMVVSAVVLGIALVIAAGRSRRSS